MVSPYNCRREVLVILPPNTNTVIEGQLLTVTRPEEHSDWSDYLSLGVLGMVCALRVVGDVTPYYIDGSVISLHSILGYIAEARSRILAVCVSALTDNYEAGLMIMRHAKVCDSSIVTVVGNDHFSALPGACMRNSPEIDYGFVGNEVVGPFVDLIRDLSHGRKPLPGAYPSLVVRDGDAISIATGTPEPVFFEYDYTLVDSLFPHSRVYSAGFQKRVVPRFRELTGRTVKAGVTVDLGRGCIKFAHDNACSFCAIQYGGLWRNALSASQAWSALEQAYRHGFDYMYITADELPLTFAPLLRSMAAAPPDWWLRRSPEERPVLVGYARADGIADKARAQLLGALGVRQVMIGIDAGTPISLAAMNKILKPMDTGFRAHAEALYRSNFQAIESARRQGILIRAGFVLGHIGMTHQLLRENQACMMEIISAGRDIISAIDIEVLSPQPGSTDFQYLINPIAAQTAARTLGLAIAGQDVLEAVATVWRGRDVIQPELAMRDYAAALMPELDFSLLIETRASIRAFAKSVGVTIGE